MNQGRMRHFGAALTGLALGLLALGPALRPGFVLSYDMVFVPHPTFSRGTFGLTGTLPRHVPSDAFVTALSTAIPADLVQKLILLAIFVMACTSAASLVPTRRLLPKLAAGVCYAWNPFVAERLLLGQWALLLGYAALPWVVQAASSVTERNGGWRLVRALAPAAVGGFAAMAVSGLTALVVVAAGRRDRRVSAFARTSIALVVVSLPWAVTGLFRAGGLAADGAAVGAFAARADTPFGALGSLLLLGGAWNAETVPVGYGTWVLATAWLAVVVIALGGYVRYCRTPWARGLGFAGAAGLIVAGLGVLVPGALRSAMDLWAGFAVLRDGQQYVAPLAVVIAVGLGVAVDRVLGADRAGVALGVCALLAPIGLLPALAWGAGGRLHAVDYPADWARVRQIVETDRVPGDVLVLPWAAYRSYPWNDGRRVLDPLPRWLGRRAVWNDAVVVGTTEIAAEDPRARALDPLIRSGGPLTGALGRAGVRFVAVDVRQDGAQWARLAGAEPVVDGPNLALYRIPAVGSVAREERIPQWPVAAAWIAALLVIMWSFLVSRITLVTRLHPPH